jgi:hypothetical protein
MNAGLNNCVLFNFRVFRVICSKLQVTMLNARVVKPSNGLGINTLCTQVVNIAMQRFGPQDVLQAIYRLST